MNTPIVQTGLAVTISSATLFYLIPVFAKIEAKPFCSFCCSPPFPPKFQGEAAADMSATTCKKKAILVKPCAAAPLNFEFWGMGGARNIRHLKSFCFFFVAQTPVVEKTSNRSSTPSLHSKHQIFERNRKRQTKLVLAHATSGNRITSATDTVGEVTQVPRCCCQGQAVKKKKGHTDFDRCIL